MHYLGKKERKRKNKSVNLRAPIVHVFEYFIHCFFLLVRGPCVQLGDIVRERSISRVFPARFLHATSSMVKRFILCDDDDDDDDVVGDTKKDAPYPARGRGGGATRCFLRPKCAVVDDGRRDGKTLFLFCGEKSSFAATMMMPNERRKETSSLRSPLLLQRNFTTTNEKSRKK